MNRDYQVIDLRWVTSDTFVLRTERKDLKFEAGQLVSLGPRGLGVNREYSLYSSEKDPHLDFLIRKVQNGTVSLALSKLKKGDNVFILGPYSDFRLKNLATSRRPLWFVATGTGIAPFCSMVRSNADLNYRMIHGVRTLGERYDHEQYAPDRYIACISEDKISAGPGLYQGRVTEFLRTVELPENGMFYLCGNNKMITDAYRLLRDRGVSSDDIQSEVFF
jgi:ferredoxin--NADP+ reductase